MDQRTSSQKLPAGLAGVLNSPDDNRDSAYFSSTDASSKHTSAASGIGVGSFTPTGSSYPKGSDETPSPTSGSVLPQPYPINGTNGMSLAAMVSPTTPGSMKSRRFESLQSIEPSTNSAAFAGHGDTPEHVSRRESVDSRINQGFNDLRLGNSQYGGHNQPTASTHETLQQQRKPKPGLESLSNHRISNGYQPSVERTPDEHIKAMRVAPAITGPAQSTIARAAEPTKGQAWAFPEEEIQRLPSGSGHPPLTASRKSSVADSLASSQFTTESRLPLGQRRLDDGLGSVDFPNLSRTSGEHPTVHHHTISKAIVGARTEDGVGVGGSQPYSRTPELRQSHKMAERKRRTEMKELFEQLRDLMPQERGTKASKWEILTKAISEHQRMSDSIRLLQAHINSQQSEIEIMKRELHVVSMENDRMQRAPAAQTLSNQYGSNQYVMAGPELPPLRSLQGASNAPANPESMTGIQYDQPRAGSYRASEPGRF